MTRAGIFGWSLPPGCTQRHIDEAFGGDPHQEAFYDAFAEAAGDIDDALFEKLAALAWKRIGDAYGEGYRQGQSDAYYAMDNSQE